MNGGRGRLAPSPTGAQHLGNARTYLIAWLSARAQGNQIILRIEDIDSPRVKTGAADLLLEDLLWLGLDWDIGPIVQSERLPLYENAFRRLQVQELVYPCTCTRRDVEEAASAPHLGHEPPPYPGTCSARRVADAANLTSVSFSWRFRFSHQLAFHDAFFGHVVPQAENGGDFVVWKNNLTPAYQLAVVVDDADLGITEVVRGEDLIPSTPRQLALYHGLDLCPPDFVHVPLVVGTDGLRLAKRHGDTRLAALRQQGVSPKACLGLLAWSCGWIPVIKPISARELLPFFSLQTIPHQPFVLQPDLLRQIVYQTF
jgi:glutamyl-tRNA synthetase